MNKGTVAVLGVVGFSLIALAIAHKMAKDNHKVSILTPFGSVKIN